MMKPINKNSIVSFRYILLSAFRLECPTIADMSLMLWKRSCAFEPALTTHNFFQTAHSSKVRETPTGTWAELIVFRSKAQRLGYQSLATVALVAWEWLQR